MPGDNNRQFAEAELCGPRIAELRKEPVSGSFDAEHLREINRRIFQDMPAAGFTDVTPGQYRPPVEETGRDWIKHRDLGPDLPGTTVAYSRMDETAINQLNNTLERADPAKLSQLDTAEFTNELADIYTQLDYVHPFPDGNSRTLRAFTEQLAEESGFNLDWSRFAANEAGRNVLYIARDLSVNELALDKVSGEDTKRELVFMLDQYGGNRNLQDLLPDAVTKSSEINRGEDLSDMVENIHDEARGLAAREDHSPEEQQRIIAIMETALSKTDLNELRAGESDVLKDFGTREEQINIAEKFLMAEQAKGADRSAALEVVNYDREIVDIDRKDAREQDYAEQARDYQSRDRDDGYEL